MAAGITGGIVIGNKEWRAEISPAMAGRRGGGFAMIGGETAKPNYEQVRQGSQHSSILRTVEFPDGRREERPCQRTVRGGHRFERKTNGLIR
jgi:hypothetical protein